jgi:hypothetical protein
MSDTMPTKQLIEDIKDMWLQTEESRRVDPVEPQFEIEFFFQTAISDMERRMSALKSHRDDQARFEAEVLEIEKELELCKKIGSLMFSPQSVRRI